MNRFSRLFLLTGLLSLLALASCSKYIGYGRVNWSIPAHSLFAGDIVPVFIQSNISQVYVVRLPDGTRAELPLWQLTLYKNRTAAEKAAKKMSEYRHTYATVKVDGLPIRAAADNTARLVYRLRLAEIIKVIGPVEGVPVMMGDSPLEGGWFEVMTDDGSTGMCYSYNLQFFDEREQDGQASSAEEGPDTLLESLLVRSWYPDHYRTMIAENRVIISKINPSWGFFPGKDSLIARIETAEGTVTFPYTAIVKDESGTYRFEGSSLAVSMRRTDLLSLQYTDKNGMPQTMYFSSLDITPASLIEAERERRSQILDGLRNSGPLFVSGSYGELRFLEGGRFMWSGYHLLTPSLIPADSLGTGTVDARYFLSESLSLEFDGILTFRFDATGAALHLLYKIDPNGLRFEAVSESFIRDSVVTGKSLNPTVLFFSPSGTASEGR